MPAGPTASGTSAPASGSNVAVATTAVAQKGTAAGEAAGKATVPAETIGFLEYAASDPTTAALATSFEAASKQLGWKVAPCDGAGTPTTMNNCLSDFVINRDSAIVIGGIPEPLIASGLGQAKAANIPTVNISGIVQPASAYSASYYPSENALGELIGEYLKQKLAGLSNPEVILQNGPGIGFQSRILGVKAGLQGSNVKVVAEPVADATNLIPGTDSQISALLTRFPQTKAVVIAYDTAMTGAAEAITAAYPGKKFPNGPLLASFYTQAAFLSLMRQGEVDALSTNSIDWTSWVAADQLAEYFARHRAMSASAQPNYGAGLDFSKYLLITPANMPPAGATDITPPVNYIQFFTAKWAAEFGK